MKTLFIVFLTTGILSPGSYAQPPKGKAPQRAIYKIPIALKSDCYLDQPHKRERIARIDSQVVVVQKVRYYPDLESVKAKKKSYYFLLVVNHRKYLPCNLPDTLTSKKLLVSGYQLEVLENEYDGVGFPFQVTKAFIIR